jgi:hypothetical protein
MEYINEGVLFQLQQNHHTQSYLKDAHPTREHA